jgi:hypothetical protein
MWYVSTVSVTQPCVCKRRVYSAYRASCIVYSMYGCTQSMHSMQHARGNLHTPAYARARSLESAPCMKHVFKGVPVLYYS